MPHCWRLDSVKALEIAGFPEWTEEDGRSFSTGPADFDDEILARKDAPAAYHLACVVDDAASGVTLVVRAADLRSWPFSLARASTPSVVRSSLGCSGPNATATPRGTRSSSSCTRHVVPSRRRW